jgi:cellulose synthase (UDP-forming)
VRRDQANAVVCCGTSYLARRAALNSIGGYFTKCLVEDYQTSTKLITEGWRVKYLNEVLSMGEVPRTFADFLDQRLRWMQGNIQIFFCSKERPIISKLNWDQLRWYLLPADLLAPLWRITYLVMPLLGLILGFSVIAAPIPEFFSYGGPFMIALYTLPNWLSGHYHHQFWMEVYETLFCFPALRRMAKVLRHPFRVYGGIVTNKDISSEEQDFNLKLSWPLLLMLALIGITIVLRYLLPLLGVGAVEASGFEGESIVLSWTLYNAIVLMVAILACIDKPVRPGADSFPIERIGCLRWQGIERWGMTKLISEQGVTFQLQATADSQALFPCPMAAANQSEAELQLMDSNLRLPVQVEATHNGLIELRFLTLPIEIQAQLLSLLYSAEHPFHAPRLMRSSDALVHWLSTLWRPDSLLRSYRSPRQRMG